MPSTRRKTSTKYCFMACFESDRHIWTPPHRDPNMGNTCKLKGNKKRYSVLSRRFHARYIPGTEQQETRPKCVLHREHFIMLLRKKPTAGAGTTQTLKQEAQRVHHYVSLLRTNNAVIKILYPTTRHETRNFATSRCCQARRRNCSPSHTLHTFVRLSLHPS